MPRFWFRGVPDKPGWYFWRKSQVTNDRSKWRAIYIDAEGYCWEGGADIRLPRGGWWSEIEGGGE